MTNGSNEDYNYTQMTDNLSVSVTTRSSLWLYYKSRHQYPSCQNCLHHASIAYHLLFSLNILLSSWLMELSLPLAPDNSTQGLSALGGIYSKFGSLNNEGNSL